MLLTVVLVALGLIAAVVAFTKDRIANALLCSAIKELTGLDTQIAHLRADLPRTALEIHGLQLHNPPGFPDEIMVDVPALDLDYRFGPLLRGQAHLEVVRLNLAQLVVVKRQDRRLNLHAIPVLAPRAPSPPATEHVGASAPPFRIDLLELDIGTVIYKDYTRTPVNVHTFPLHVHERHVQLTHPQTLITLLIVRALLKTTVAELAGFELPALKAGLAEALGTADAAVSEVEHRVEHLIGR